MDHLSFENISSFAFRKCWDVRDSAESANAKDHKIHLICLESQSIFFYFLSQNCYWKQLISLIKNFQNQVVGLLHLRNKFRVRIAMFVDKNFCACYIIKIKKPAFENRRFATFMHCRHHDNYQISAHFTAFRKIGLRNCVQGLSNLKQKFIYTRALHK
jgi:hypothetical protein